MTDLEKNIEFVNKRIVQQCEYICNTFARYDRGEISEKRCRELVDSAVGIKNNLKFYLMKCEIKKEMDECGYCTERSLITGVCDCIKR